MENNGNDKDKEEQQQQPNKQQQQPQPQLRESGSFVGMRNFCFMNSLLQSMYTLNLLRDLVLGEGVAAEAESSTIPSPSSPPASLPTTGGGRVLDTPAIKIWREQGYNEQLKLTCHFLNTLRDVWKSNKSPIIPVDILKAIAGKYSQYNDFGQQDSHEFLRQLFDAMRMEELDVIYADNPDLKEKSNKRIKKLQPHHYQSVTPTTFVDLLCEGMVVNVIICASCKQIYHVYEPFLDISLALQDENKQPKRRGFRQSIRESLLGPKPEGIKKDELTVEDVVLSDTEEDEDDEHKIDEEAPPQPKSKRFSFRNSFSLGSSTPRSSLRRPSGLAAFPPPSPSSSSPHQNASQLSAPPAGGMLGRKLSKRGGNRRASRSVSGMTDVDDDTANRRSRRTLEDKIYTQKLFGDLTTPSTPQSTHSASMSELASEQTMTSLSSTPPRELRDGQSVNASNSQNSVLAALRQPPPTQTQSQSNEGSAGTGPGSEPLSTAPSTTAATPSKTGIEEAFERYAGIETLQNENEFHCHGCWKSQNEVQVEMIRKFRDSRRKDKKDDKKERLSLGLGLGGMTPLQEGEQMESVDARNRENGERTTTTTTNTTDKENEKSDNTINDNTDLTTTQPDVDYDEESDAEDDDDISEKDWNEFYGDTVPFIPRKKQVIGTKALRRTLIAIAPPVLVLHLKRFGSVGGFALSKIFDNITFPTELDIGPYIAPERPARSAEKEKSDTDALALDLPDDVDPTTTEDYKRLAELAYPVNSTRYRLRSTVNHVGRTMISGHYTAFASREEKIVGEDGTVQLQWYWASDETVKEKTEEQFLNESFKNDDQNIYVLVYERM
ncbi:hypothetical protein E3P99_01360 [Wallemia hederae]|uniref:ubiquitinyl hydrolase 1 n=1 Tax=Wallemia hederae TaxID=1540922 RepID=A0A4T0FV26_9BASI|nr:hypothetical protein E3P99_01360 [Wallemia hederae]